MQLDFNYSASQLNSTSYSPEILIFIIPFVLIPIQGGSKVDHLILMLMAKKTAKSDSYKIIQCLMGKLRPRIWFFQFKVPCM